MQNRKTAIIYGSKYGSTKRYAEWIAQETQADLFESRTVRLDQLFNYDTIVYGGALYAVGISGFKLISDNYHALKGKKIIVFSVGASSICHKTIEDVTKKNFTQQMRGNIRYFHLRGIFDYQKLNWLDKMLMSLLRWQLTKKKPEELDADAKMMLSCFNQSFDWTDKQAILPIVACIEEGTGYQD